MKSRPHHRKLTFAALQARLIQFVRICIQNGDFTERALARALGISQAQIHNVLKGARKLKPELADRIMSQLDLSVLDLLENAELVEEVSARESISFDSSAGTDNLPSRLIEPRRLLLEPARSLEPQK